MTYEIPIETEEEIRNWAETRSKEKALNFDYNRATTRLSYKEEIFDLDEEGNVIRSEVCDSWAEARKRVEEWINEIFGKGEQNRHWIVSVTLSEEEYTYYDPDRMNEWKSDTINTRISFEKQRIKKEEEKKKRYERWDAAVQWCSEHGVRTFKGYNRRETLTKNIVKNDLQEEFNKEFPEFAISETDIEWYQTFWGKKKEKFVEKKGGKR